MKSITKRLISLLVIACICVTMMCTAVYADNADFYYWNYEESLDDVGDKLNLAPQSSNGDSEPSYEDGVIADTYCVEMTSTRFATANLDKAVESFTFASWFYLPSEYTNRFQYTTLFSIGNYGVVDSFVHCFFEASDEQFNLCIQVGETGAAITKVDKDQWYHFGWTYDAATKTSKVYLDGVVVYDQAMTTSYVGIPAETTFYIGHQVVQALPTDTLIDETVFAPSVWSEDQIKALHSDPAAAAIALSDAFKPAETPDTPADPTPDTPSDPTPDTPPETGDLSSNTMICLFAIILASAVSIIMLSKKRCF